MRKLLYTDSGKSSGLIASFWKNHHLVILCLTYSGLGLTTACTELWGRGPGLRGYWREPGDRCMSTHMPRCLRSGSL